MDQSANVLAKGVTTAELIDSGIALMRQNLRRRHPADSESAIDARLGNWLYRQDEPPGGDVAGPVRIRRPHA